MVDADGPTLRPMAAARRRRDPDVVLVHAPSVYDFRERSIFYGPISDVIPSSPVFEMYPVGFLFGLGFDTVTEIGLLVIAGGAVAADLPWWAVITLPVLFAACMSLLDTIDGAFMNVAYGWAFSRPVRKIYYNLTVTALSVAVAAIIGTVTLGSMLAENLDVRSGPLAWLAGLDLEYVGYGIVGLFVAAWAISVGVWRYGRIEERWSAHLRSG